MNKPAWQQHTAIGMGADRAVDGRYSDLTGAGGQCSISGYGHTTAEWRVDLGDVHSIHHVFIQFLTENENMGYRFQNTINEINRKKH